MNQLAALIDTVSLAEARGMQLLPPGLGLAHLWSMVDRVQEAKESGNPFSDSKLGRWLGWAQCAVVFSGISTLDEMKELNKRYAD